MILAAIAEPMMPSPITPIASRVGMLIPPGVLRARRLLGRRCSERFHRSEQPFDRFASNVAHDEYDARTRVGVVTRLERHRRMENVLRSLQNDRARLPFHVHNTLDSQQVWSPQLSERLQYRVQTFQLERRIEP